MAEYHVGCGLAGIYAGTLKTNGIEWRNKSDVTEEAVCAVANFMYFMIPDGEDSFGYRFKMRDGKHIHFKVEVIEDEMPVQKTSKDFS